MRRTTRSRIRSMLFVSLVGTLGCSNPLWSDDEGGESSEGRGEGSEAGGQGSESTGEHSGEGSAPAGEGSESRGGQSGEGSESGGEGSESGGEHSGEGSESGGEGSESRGEQGSEGGGESGTHQEEGSQQLSLDQSYDQVRNGARLRMEYEPGTNAFVGSVENTASQILRRVRVEVHLSDGSNAVTAELGPTTPIDLQPGEVITLNLSAEGESFNDWSPHVEVGSGEGGGEVGGSEGGGEGGGNEGNEGPGHAEGSEGGEGGETDPASPILALDESWDGIVNGLRVAMSYDSDKRAFSGIVENTTAETVCFAQIELNLKQGTKTVVELGPDPVGDLAPNGQIATQLLVADEPSAKGIVFDSWQIHPEVFDCGGPGPQSSQEGQSGERGDETAIEALSWGQVKTQIANPQ